MSYHLVLVSPSDYPALFPILITAGNKMLIICSEFSQVCQIGYHLAMTLNPPSNIITRHSYHYCLYFDLTWKHSNRKCQKTSHISTWSPSDLQSCSILFSLDLSSCSKRLSLAASSLTDSVN